MSNFSHVFIENNKHDLKSLLKDIQSLFRINYSLKYIWFIKICICFGVMGIIMINEVGESNNLSAPELRLIKPRKDQKSKTSF